MSRKLYAFAAASSLILSAGGALVYAEEDPDYTIGICQFAQHESLDEAARGFQDALTEKLPDRVTFDDRNAKGDYTVCTTIIGDFIAQEVDLILANSTTSLQIAATSTADIPILGTSVTEYGAALQLEDFDGTAGGNISGTSDVAPFEQQAAMIRELFPAAGQIGLLYCSAEPNSQYQADEMQENLEAAGYSCKRYTFSESNEISSVAMIAAQESDVLYIPTDNMAASNAQLIANICMPEQVPVVTGDESTCQICGVATLSIDYYDLGYTTGEMAVRILEDGEDISAMPVEYASSFTKKYNPDICEELGFTVPGDYEALQD